MHRKRFPRLVKALWWLATAVAKAARKIEGLGLERTPTPGFDFDHDSYWWDLCQNDQFQRAVRAMGANEEKKSLDLMFTFTQNATGRTSEAWQHVAAAGAAVQIFRELPWLVIGYGGRYVNNQKKKVEEDARTADRLTTGRQRR